MREWVWLGLGLALIPVSLMATSMGYPAQGMILGFLAFLLCIIVAIKDEQVTVNI